jgi:hypothetical protein
VAWATLLVLAWLTAPATKVDAPVPEPSAPTPSTGAATQAPTPERAPVPAPERAPAPTTAADTSTSPASTTLVDPWAAVPVQTPKRVQSPPVVQSALPRWSGTNAPLLDPWARGLRPSSTDPELRDPFHAMRAQGGRHLAHTELRDPFARRQTAAAVAPRPEPTLGMPPHPDLRDPFQRRPTARPTPPRDASERAAPDDRPRPPTTPPTAVPPPEPTPRSGALDPSPFPLAHLPRARRPA